MSKKTRENKKDAFLVRPLSVAHISSKKMFDSFNEFSFPKTHLKFRFVYLKDCERF